MITSSTSRVVLIVTLLLVSEWVFGAAQVPAELEARLIKLGKTFDYMTCPDRNHGISEGEGTSLHVRMLMARYFVNHLPLGPR